MRQVEFILYVADQERSTDFYRHLLRIEPCLNVPGMTEFDLTDSARLGLMPEDGIAKILGDEMPHPNRGHGIPRCELYLRIENALEYLKRGVELGALEISKFKDRDWGEKVGYISDLDGHVITFAEMAKT